MRAITEPFGRVLPPQRRERIGQFIASVGRQLWILVRLVAGQGTRAARKLARRWNEAADRRSERRRPTRFDELELQEVTVALHALHRDAGRARN